MPKSARVHSLFPTFVYQDEIFSPRAKINAELLEEIAQFRRIDKNGVQWSKKNYPGGYTSYGSMDQLFRLSSTFDELRLKIDASMAKYVRALEIDIRPQELKMDSMWVNVMPPGVSHSMHIHPLSVISGTYYLQVPKGTRGLKLEDPRMVNFMASPPRKAKARQPNQRFVEMSPREGEVLLFESWLRHEVPVNPTRSDRVSISFNYSW